MMKYLAFALLAFAPVTFAEVLITKNFTIQIERACEEGEVTCDSMQFTLNSSDQKEAKELTGKTVHSLCADGVTPCGFRGYEFHSDGITYFIHNSGALELLNSEGDLVLVEQGEWEY